MGYEELIDHLKSLDLHADMVSDDDGDVGLREFGGVHESLT